jgi:hypothetical protein
VDDWIERAADALGEDRLRAEETSLVLRLARDVAHGAERRMAPLAAFLAGAAAGRAVSDERLTRLRTAVDELERLLPAAADDPD